MSSIAEKFKLQSIQHARAGDSATELDILPTAGVRTISVVCQITTGHGTAMIMTLSTADDAAGTNTAVLTENVPVYLNGVRQTDAKACTIQNTYNGLGLLKNFVVFEVPANIIPTGKYLGIHLTAGGNSGNILSAVAVEDTYYKG
jgi:hypothetical protein